LKFDSRFENYIGELNNGQHPTTLVTLITLKQLY